MVTKFWRIFLTIPIWLIVFGCADDKNKFAPPPPPEVTVAQPKVEDVTEYKYTTGQTSAKESVEIRARVKGFLQKVHFTDGSLVKEDDLLITIDPSEYKAELDNQKAQFQSAQAAATYAKNDLSRREKAYKARAISEMDLLSSRSDRDQAVAAVAQAKAAVETAKLNLSYTEIHAPFTGRISRRLVDEGNLVGADGTTLLTTIVKLKPIYVYFTINERDVVEYLRIMTEEDRRGLRGEDTQPPDLELALTGDDGYPHNGVLDYMDNEVDPDTGTIQARGLFQNDGLLLIPGLFAKIRIPTGVKKDALLVPDLAVGLDQAGSYVLVVDKDNVVQRQSIQTGQLVGSMRVIEKGVNKEDRVVVKGILRARPGAKVNPVTAEEAGAQEKEEKTSTAGEQPKS